MKLWTRFVTWRAIRRHQRHIRWLRKARVMLGPHSSCQRNGPECV